MIECKYCFTECNDGITPCSCTTPVHKECLKRWLEESGSGNCEICHTRYRNVRIVDQTLISSSICCLSLFVSIISTVSLYIMVRGNSAIPFFVYFMVILYTFVSLSIIGHLLLWRVNNSFSHKKIIFE